MWDEYPILLHPNLPSCSLELLIFGANLSLYWNGYIAWARSMLRGAEARLSKFDGMVAIVVVSWDVYKST